MGPRKYYSGDVFEQLREMYAKLEAQEKRMNELSEYSDRRISNLTDELEEARKEITDLKEENQLLKDDNERLKRIINNDSNNSSKPYAQPRRKECNRHRDQYGRQEILLLRPMKTGSTTSPRNFKGERKDA